MISQCEQNDNDKTIVINFLFFNCSKEISKIELVSYNSEKK